MGFLDQVVSGDQGVRFSVPESFDIISESPTAALLVNHREKFGLQLSWCQYRLDLSPRHERLLQLDLERQTRDSFLQVWEQRSQDGSPRDRRCLYSDDPKSSPLISANTIELKGAPALEALHRLTHEPGSEIVMGHLVIPVKSGMFEFRVTANAEMTGVKESILVAEILQRPRLKADSLEQVLQEKLPNMDEPALDERFPDHPLAIVRRAQKWLREEAEISIEAPGVAQVSGEVVLTLLQCALTPPPR